jgi:hypothetical protein
MGNDSYGILYICEVNLLFEYFASLEPLSIVTDLAGTLGTIVAYFMSSLNKSK